MLRLGSERENLGVVIDQLGTPTYAGDLAKAIMTIICVNSSAFGLYHYSNEGVASWYDFAHAIFEFKDISTVLKPIKTEAYPTPAARPRNSIMDKSKFKKEFGIQIPHWRESLQKCLNSL